MCRAGSRDSRAGGGGAAAPSSAPVPRPRGWPAEGMARPVRRCVWDRAGVRAAAARREPPALPAARLRGARTRGARAQRRRVTFPRKLQKRARAAGGRCPAEGREGVLRPSPPRPPVRRFRRAPSEPRAPDPASPWPRIAPSLRTGPRRVPFQLEGSAGLFPGSGGRGDGVP